MSLATTIRPILCAFACFILVSSCFGHDGEKQSQTKGTIELDDTPSVIVKIDTSHTGLRLYFPPTDSIDLQCLVRPEPLIDTAIVFCCAAAFTGTGSLSHTNIAGDHVSSGKRYKGYRCPRNTGAFVFYNGLWRFLYLEYSHELDMAALNNGAGFAQEMMIHMGVQVPTTRSPKNVNLYRALCEIDGALCIADATESKPFGDFIQSLLDAGVTEALYTDMGYNWNYSWYRESPEGEAHFIHQDFEPSATNWIVFYSR